MFSCAIVDTRLSYFALRAHSVSFVGQISAEVDGTTRDVGEAVPRFSRHEACWPNTRTRVPAKGDAVAAEFREETIDPEHAGCDAYHSGWQLQLLGTFSVCQYDREIRLGIREQRTVALVALQGARSRSYIAGTLWPEVTETRAFGSLRAAIWNIRHAAHGLLSYDRQKVALGPHVQADVDDLIRCAARAMQSTDGESAPFAIGEEAQHGPVLSVLTRGDLLPEWQDDWVSFERTRLQLLRLRGLEALSAKLLDHGQTASAMSAALAATSIEPLRESAQRAVIRAYIAEGNHHAALRDYQQFRGRLFWELGVLPSDQLNELIRPLVRPDLTQSDFASPS
jgi:DNA-binding SARP family transcriptional activator